MFPYLHENNSINHKIRREVPSTEEPEIIEYFDEGSPVSKVTVLSENGVPLSRRRVYVNTAFEVAPDGSSRKISKNSETSQKKV